MTIAKIAILHAITLQSVAMYGIVEIHYVLGGNPLVAQIASQANAMYRDKALNSRPVMGWRESA